MSEFDNDTVDRLNKSDPVRAAVRLGDKLQALEADQNEITLDELSVGIRPSHIVKAAVSAKTTSREENVAGLSSAIVLANEIRTDIISHFANATRHTTGQQSTSAIAAVAIDLTSLIALTTSVMALYVAHNADAILASGWAYHSEQATTKALASAVAPINLQECITKLNDVKAKYNDHEDETTGHNSTASVTADQVAAANAAYGVAIDVVVTGAAASDVVIWGILNDGTGNVTGVSAVAGTNKVTFTFSADPQNDAIISFAVLRIAV